MKRSELEKHIGESVEVKLFDGDTMQGVLRKTGTEEVRNNPKPYRKKTRISQKRKGRKWGVYGTGQYNMIQKEVRKVIMTESENGNICPAEWENRLTNALSVWVMSKTAEYQKYLQG